MGLQPLDQVPPVTFLRRPRAGDDLGPGEVRADGVCRLDAVALRRRFGVRAPGPTVWQVAVVVVSEDPVDPTQMQRHEQDLAAFTAAGPDDRADVYNFYEATGGRARLVPMIPRPR